MIFSFQPLPHLSQDSSLQSILYAEGVDRCPLDKNALVIKCPEATGLGSVHTPF